MNKRTRIIAALALAALVVTSVFINIALRGPSRASATDAALDAADRIIAENGGGQQPVDASGRPADAPAEPPIRRAEFGR